MSNSVSVITNGLYLAAHWPFGAQLVCVQLDTQALTKTIK